MAIENYNPVQFATGQCVGPDELQPVFGNLKALANFAKGTGGRISCEKINGVANEDVNLTANGQGDEDNGCLILRSKANTQPDEQLEKKLPMVSVDSSDNFYQVIGGGGEDIEITSTTEVSFLCDGVSVWSGDVSDVILASFDCLPSSEIRICFKTTVTSNQIFNFVTIDRQQRTHTVCGGSICLERFDESSSLPDFFCPPCALTTESKPGREVLCLIYQNTLSLCRYFQQGQQVFACQDFTFNDDLTHSLITSAVTKTTYFIVGQIQVCFTLNFELLSSNVASDIEITVNPVIGCNGEKNECPPKTFIFSDLDNNVFGGERCVTVPVFVCGTCDPGETLSVGFSVNSKCAEQPQPFEDIGQVSVSFIEQQYCAFLWEELTIPELSTFQPPNADCLSVKTLNDLTQKQDLIEGLVCDRGSVQCRLDQGQSILDKDGVKLLSATQTPPTPIPLDWPYNRKITLIVTFQFCITYPVDNNNNPPLTGSGTLDILCGGAVIKTIDNNGEPFRWMINRDSYFPQCSEIKTRICCNIDCPVDQSLEIRANTSAPNASSFPVHQTFIDCTQIGF